MTHSKSGGDYDDGELVRERRDDSDRDSSSMLQKVFRKFIPDSRDEVRHAGKHGLFWKKIKDTHYTLKTDDLFQSSFTW